MAATPNNADDTDIKQQQQQQPLSVPIHPDDAKDKVFTAILKALLEMDNKPSSPKELANVITQSKYATLGGSTPFATVSSRISQHFKRAAQHKPPRLPLLTRHVDSSHSRKINYSLATKSILPSPTPSSPASPAPTPSEKIQPQQKSKRKEAQILSSEDDAPTTRPARQTRSKRRRIQKHDMIYIYDSKIITNTKGSRSISKPIIAATLSAPVTVPNVSRKPEAPFMSDPIDTTTSTIAISNDDTNNSDHDSSDYYQDMLDETLDPFDESSKPINEPSLPLSVPQQSDTINDSALNYQHINDANTLWTNDIAVDDDFGLVHLPDSSTAHHLSFEIDAPETVPISELDDYFGTDKEISTAVRSNHTLPSDTKHAHLQVESALLSHPLKDARSDNETDRTFIDNHKDYVQKLRKHQRRHSWPIFSQQTPSMYTPNNSIASSTNEFSWNLSNNTLSADSSQHLISDQLAEQDQYDDSQNTNNTFDSTHRVISDSEQSTLSSTTRVGNTCNDGSFLHFEDDDDADDESDMPPNYTSTHPLKNVVSTATLLDIPTLTKLLELMHGNQADFTVLQQIIAATPDLKYLLPLIGQIKSLAAYLQQTTTGDTDTLISRSQSTVDSGSSNSQQDSDIDTILTQFPILKFLLDKDHAQQNLSPKQQPTSPEAIMVQTTSFTSPAMYITVIDGVAVCVAILPPTFDIPEYRIMRRLDLDYVNGTTLLLAGGIDTERERSVIFSLEKDRLRIRRQNSILNGTWLPLRRAQHLAATCSIEHRLGSFLDDCIESHFPSPLPVNVVKRQPIKRNSAQRHIPYSWKMGDGQEQCILSKNASFVSDGDDDHSTGAFWFDSTLDLSMPGNFSVSGIGTGPDDSQKQKSAGTSPSSTAQTTAQSNAKTTLWATNTNDFSPGQEEETTDTDSDTEVIRRQARRDYDAAVNAISEDTSLDDLINRQYGQNKSANGSIQNKGYRKHRLHSTTQQKASVRRRKNSTINNTGKTLPPNIIRKSVSWHGSLNLRQFPKAPPSGTPFSAASKKHQMNQKIKYPTHLPFNMAGSIKLSTHDGDEDADEIDIGGSGCGDDLR